MTALKGWKRNVAALAVVFAAYGVASLLGSPPAYYAAALIGFTTWMVWFVFTGVDFLRILDT